MVGQTGTEKIQLGGEGVKKEELVKKVPGGTSWSGVVLPAGIILLVIFAGVGTGWLLAGKSAGRTGMMGAVTGGINAVGGVGACKDEATFRDSAEGNLEEGGIDGEGTHHLVREGGPSQNVYLTSTVVDLDEFVGKKVKVLGETIGGQKAGWLMDVGCVKPL